jgi:imidazolonepropionase-like amidohydrolase
MLVLAAVASLIAIAQSGIGERARPQLFAISNVRVFDGEHARGNLYVVIDNGIIRALETTGKKLRDVPTIDGSGATLLPGLIDGHAHPRSVAALRDALRFGVTTVLDMGSDGHEQLLRHAAASRVDVADIRSAGFVATAPGGHGTEFGHTVPTVSGPTAAEAFVEARKASGADYLKVVLNGSRGATGTPQLSEDTVKALVRAAHARNMLVVAHVETQADVQTALAAGVDILGHVWRDRGAVPEMAHRIRAQNAFVAPTLSMPDSLVPGALASLAADPRLAPFLSDSQRAQLARPALFPPRKNIDERVDATRSLLMARVRLLAGSDAGGAMPTVIGLSMHRELELLVKSGLTPTQALASATAHVADAFRLSDRGRILPGQRADLLLVRGDPTIDITATRDVLRVWRSGVEFDRSVQQPR